MCRIIEWWDNASFRNKTDNFSFPEVLLVIEEHLKQI